MTRNVMAGLAFVMLFMAGCRKDPINNLSEDESRIYITNRNEAVDFSTYSTYSIADSVTVIDGNQVRTQFNNTDQAFINALKSKMQELGYTFVSRSANPDLGISVSRIINTSTGVINYNNYWNNYYGNFYDPFYWGYPGYGWGTPGWGFATYEIKEGLLTIDMVDLKNAASNNNNINVIWNGMIRGSGIFNAATAASQVNALFAQSPYLSKN